MHPCEWETVLFYTDHICTKLQGKDISFVLEGGHHK